MSFLLPLALVALAIPIGIYVIHLLFGSRRRLRVPAIFLWADLPRTSSGRSRRRLPPVTLLLLVQLLLATLAALALARPTTPGEPPRHLALILDASGSMQATDVTPSRFAAARTAAAARLADLRATDLVSVVRAGREATLLVSGPPDRARAALDAAQPDTAPAALREALALASDQVVRTPERAAQIVVVSDLAWPPLDSVGPLAAPLEVVGIGGGAENQTVSALVVRMDATGRAQTAFVEVANQAEHAVRVPVRVTADGGPLDERQLEIPARGRARFSLSLPVDARRVAARLLSRDALALDDAIETLAPGGPPRDVLVLGQPSDGVRRALEAVPALRLRGTEQPPPSLTVLDGVLPPQLPPGPLLLIGPPPSSARLLGVGLGSGARTQPNHPLLRGLDLGALQHEVPLVGGVPGWARVVFGTVAGPLLMEGRLEGHPTVALVFDPSLSGLEKSLAFPLLISNATTFLFNQADGPPPVAEPFDGVEADIAPRPVPAILTEPGVTAQVRPDAPPAMLGPGLTERWSWLLGAVLLLLGAEWLIFARRG